MVDKIQSKFFINQDPNLDRTPFTDKKATRLEFKGLDKTIYMVAATKIEGADPNVTPKLSGWDRFWKRFVVLKATDKEGLIFWFKVNINSLNQRLYVPKSIIKTGNQEEIEKAIQKRFNLRDEQEPARSLSQEHTVTPLNEVIKSSIDHQPKQIESPKQPPKPITDQKSAAPQSPKTENQPLHPQPVENEQTAKPDDLEQPHPQF